MKNPFKPTGFDALIHGGHVIEGSLKLSQGTTTIFDGTMRGDSITVQSIIPNDAANASTTLVVNGVVDALKVVEVPNVTICGDLTCDELIVTGILAIKKSARVKCGRIRYKTLVVETGARLNGPMEYIEEVGAASVPPTA